jgi:hypothetical protein
MKLPAGTKKPAATPRASRASLEGETPQAAPSTLAGSTFTPGPMVEEIAIRSI